MTQKQLVDSVKARASEDEVRFNLDDQTVMVFGNDAVRDVNFRAFPFSMDYFEVDGVNIISTPQLPIGLLGGRPIRVVCTNPDTSASVEARYAATPKEFWKIQAHTRNLATNAYPVYFIGNHASNTRTLTIWPTTIAVATADLWKLPDDLSITGSDASTVVPVPPGWEVAAVYGTLLECITKMKERDKMQATIAQYQSNINDIVENARMQTVAKRVSIQAMPSLQKNK